MPSQLLEYEYTVIPTRLKVSFPSEPTALSKCSTPTAELPMLVNNSPESNLSSSSGCKIEVLLAKFTTRRNTCPLVEVLSSGRNEACSPQVSMIVTLAAARRNSTFTSVFCLKLLSFNITGVECPSIIKVSGTSATPASIPVTCILFVVTRRAFKSFKSARD